MDGAEASHWIVTSGQVAAGAAAVSAVILAVAAIAAFQQLREARRLREARFRPFVTVDLDVSRPPIAILTVSNLGPVQARNVRLTFSPEIRSSLDDHQSVFGELKPIKDGIKYLAPGKSHRLVWDSALNRWNQDDAGTPKDGYPDHYDVAIHYEADVGRRKLRTFDEQGEIDLGLYRNTADIRLRDVDDVATNLERIAKEIAKWTSSTPRGLRVVDGDETRRTIEELRRRREDGSKTPADEGKPVLALRSSPPPASRPLLRRPREMPVLRVGPLAPPRHAPERVVSDARTG
jgi:hypothetical protein